MGSKACTFYLPMTGPSGTPMSGAPTVRSWDGQALQSVGNPQWRHGKMWNNDSGWGLEFGEAMADDQWSDHFAENEDPDYSGSVPAAGWSSYNATYSYGKREWVRSMFNVNGLAMRLVDTTGTTNHGVYAPTVDPGETISFYALGSDWSNISIYVNVSGYTYNKVEVGSFQGEPVYRISATKTTATGNIWFRPNNNNGNFDCWMCGWQKETNDWATPTNSVGEQRVYGQYLGIPTAGNFPGFDGGTIIMSYTPNFKYNEPDHYYGLFTMRADAAVTDYWSFGYAQDGDSWWFGTHDGSTYTYRSLATTHNRMDKLHIVITWNGTTKEFWVNGVPSSTGNTNGSNQQNCTESDMFYIGRAYQLDANGIGGVMNEYAVLNYPVNQTLVNELYGIFQNKRSLRDYIL